MMSEEVTIDKIDQVLTNLKDAVSILEPIKELIQKNIELGSENDRMRQEHAEMKAELEHASSELEKVSADFSDLMKKKGETIRLREVLGISMTLLSDVFGAAPHSKLLFLLHGDIGQGATRDTLVKASGLSAVSVRIALKDLDAAKIVDYNVETGEVKLLKKIY